MKIAIIGAGFTGLTSAFRLQQSGHEVSVFEKESKPGGLAIGVEEKDWEWSLEEHYHHWFTNDADILGLANDIGHKIIVKRPKTSSFVEGKIFQFDSPKSILLFPKLSIADRIRMGIVLGMIKYNPFWKPLEKLNASRLLPKLMGRKAYEMIWEPLFINKFGDFAGDVSMAWFWARLSKRTPFLAYPEGGFLKFAEAIVKKIRDLKGEVLFDTETISVKDGEKHASVIIKKRGGREEKIVFDKVIVTLPSGLFLRVAPQLPQGYKESLQRLKGIGATNLVLRLKKQFFEDGTYWLSICDKDSPVMAIVEHTNFMDSKHYNNEHLVYLGNYLPVDDKNYSTSKERLLELYDPYLKKINKDYKKNLIEYKLFKAPFAQPIIPANYSRIIPPHTTPIKNVFLANIEQVYPWDRGTNYAVEVGKRVADLVTKK